MPRTLAWVWLVGLALLVIGTPAGLWVACGATWGGVAIYAEVLVVCLAIIVLVNGDEVDVVWNLIPIVVLISHVVGAVAFVWLRDMSWGGALRALLIGLAGTSGVVIAALALMASVCLTMASVETLRGKRT